MSRVQQYQASFTVGEIDPLLRGRIDLQQYYSSVSEATNVIFEPQGGFSRRPGLKFIQDITADNPQNGHMLIPFEFSTSSNFMVLASATITNMPNAKIRFRIYKNQQLITNINGTGDDYLDYGVGTLYNVTDFDINKLYYTQSADTVICTHENFRPFSLVRGATDQDWSATSLAGSLTIPKHAFTIVTTRPATTITPDKVDGTVTITAGSSIFTSADIDQFIEVDDGFGRLRITQFISGTEVKGITEVPFFDTSAIASNTYIIERGYEDAWSDSRGWTKTATFHEGRLYFGGSASLPSTLFGSKVNDFFNFKASEGLDDDALKVTLATDQVNSITALRSGRDLQVFTTGSEFFVPQGDLDPITPSNIVIKSATKRGAKENIRPQAAEGGTLFIQRQGKSIRELLFSDVELSYVANNISLLASHLIVDPKRLALRRATDTTEGDLLMVLNGTDSSGYRAASTELVGGIAAYMLNKGQNIVAPSLLVTNGIFTDVSVDLDDIFVVVKRNIGGSDKYFVEVFDDDFTTDAGAQIVSGFSGTTYSGYSHLNGKTVDIIRDDIIDPQVTVAGGNITVGDVPTNYIEAGLPYTISVTTNPVETRLPSGIVQGQKKRILEVSPVLYKTQNITINGRQIPLKTLPVSGVGGVSAFTGVKKTPGFLGFEREAKITISQDQPVFLTVLSLDYKVSVGQ